MVASNASMTALNRYFQYSLCRVVLMVERLAAVVAKLGQLSVLALSSRFDGRTSALASPSPGYPFSTRSVESF